MKIGLPREIRQDEYRVGLVPGGVQALVDEGHDVLVEEDAGAGSGFSDNEYLAAGARIAPSAADVWGFADLVVKVKEPGDEELALLKPGLLLFTYLHLATDPKRTEALLARRVTALAYETLTAKDGSLPLLMPMSKVAGRMAVQVGANLLMKTNGGRGILLGGVPGVAPGDVVIIGGGTVGFNAAKVAVGLGARVTVLDILQERLAHLDDVFGSRVVTFASNPYIIPRLVATAHLVIGAVLIPGASAPKLVDRETIRSMKKGAVVVDVSVDQGGCFETTRPTTHSAPTYEVDGVIHYCVDNIAGAVPRTSTLALTNATLPYVVKLARWGLADALRKEPALRSGVNTHAGALTFEPVAREQGKAYQALEQLVR